MRASLAALGLGLLSLLVLALAGPAYRIGLPLGMAFTLLRFAAYIGLAALAVGVSVAAWQLKKGARVPALMAALGVVAGITAAAIPYSWQGRAQRLPVIHDISTDLENPPAFVAAVALRADSPNSLERGADVTQQQRQGYPDLAPLTLAEPSAQVLARARETAERLGWNIVNVDERSGLIEATDTTRWFGFVDDVAIRITPWGTGTRVDLRSVSRVGRSDVGTNAGRIRAFLRALQEP
jgi:uncharacterized protein (DUF1499 family)